MSHLSIVGHRGARGLAPENTLASIRKALAQHVDEIEVDIRITSDGKAVLIHDKSCLDASGSRLRIRDHTYAELLKHKSDLTTLEQAIAEVDRQTPLQLEIKWGEPTKPVTDILASFLAKGWQPTDFLLGSKKQTTLMQAHRVLPDIPTVVIEPFSGVRAVWRARQLGTKRLSMRQQWLWSGFIRPMSRRGYQLYAYTLNDPAKAARWAGYGLAGVITDVPDVFERRHSRP